MPKIIDHDQRRRDIVAVARRLILQGGLEAATMRSLAAEAGFANGALKHYFRGKNSIIAATFQSVLAGIDPRGVADPHIRRPERDPVQNLRDCFDMWMPLSESEINAGRVLLVLWDQAASNPELAELYRRFFARWGEEIVGLLRAIRAEMGALPEAEYERLSLEIRSTVIAANVVNLMHPGSEHVATYRACVESLIQRILAPA
jgi:AcrR family transcriptional regulator